MKKITVYTAIPCSYCLQAKRLLQNHGYEFAEIDLSRDYEKRMQISSETGWQTVPMIYIGDEFVGGFDELNRLSLNGELALKVEEQ